MIVVRVVEVDAAVAVKKSNNKRQKLLHQLSPPPPPPRNRATMPRQRQTAQRMTECVKPLAAACTFRTIFTYVFS